MEIITTPNKILESKSEKVPEVSDKIKKLVDKMLKTKKQSKGVGLAANQIGVNLRIAVVGFKPEDDKDEAIPEYILINPEITYKSDEISTQSERCLSDKDEPIDVPRATKIHVQYIDIDGKKKKLKARGVLARIIQHEIDHLDGKTISYYK